MGWDSCTPMWLSTWLPLIVSVGLLALLGLGWLIVIVVRLIRLGRGT